MSWLDAFFQSGYKQIQIAGVPIAAENILNFVIGVSGVDNPGLLRTDLTVNGTGGAYAVQRASGTGASITIPSSSLPQTASYFSLTAAAICVLPASPAAGQVVTLVDEDGTGVSFGVTVQGNGNNIVAFAAGVANYVFSTAGNGFASRSTLELEWITGAGFWKVMG